MIEFAIGILTSLWHPETIKWVVGLVLVYGLAKGLFIWTEYVGKKSDKPFNIPMGRLSHKYGWTHEPPDENGQ